MKQFLLRRWFLLALAAGALLGALVPDRLRPAVALLPPRAVVSLALFFMAWGLESRSLGRSLLRPLPALWASAISYGLVPLLAWAFARWLPVAMDFRAGLVIMAAAPCTLASAVLWTRLGGGNEAVALLTVVLTTATSWLVTPLWLAPLAGGRVVSLDTVGMMRDLLLYMVVPVLAGQLARAVPALAALATRRKGVLGVLSQLLILAILLKAATDAGGRLRTNAADYDLVSVLVIAAAGVVTHLTALGVGLGGSRLLGFDRPSRVAVAFACSQKTLPVALLVFTDFFRESYPLAVLPIVLYHFSQLVADTFIADRLHQPAVTKKEANPEP